MKRVTFILFRLIFAFYIIGTIEYSAHAEDESGRSLSLEEFILIASQKDTVFQEILINELFLKYEKALNLPPGDLVLSIKSQYNLFFNPNESDFSNYIALSKLFPYSGTSIKAEYNSLIASESREATSEFTAYISQPVAENAFGRNTRLLDHIIGLETEVSHYQIIEAYEDYLAKIIKIYYDWYSAFENVKTAQNSYNENLKLLKNIKEREKHRIALPVDVNKVRLQVVAKKESLIILQNDYVDYFNRIKEAIRYDGSDILEPADSSLYSDLDIDFNRDYRIFVDESRTSRILKLLEEKSSVEVDKYADELLPSINLVAGVTLEGYGHTVDNSDKQIFAGVYLDWPIPGQVERAQYETAKINRRKTELSSENIHIRLYTDLKNLNNQIQKEKEIITLADEKIVLAKAVVDDDTENYSLGRLTLNDLISEINILETSKFNKIYHTIQLRKLIVEWLRLSDRLVSKDPSEKMKQMNE